MKWWKDAARKPTQAFRIEDINIPRETETEEFVGFDGKPDVCLEKPRFSEKHRFFPNRRKSAFLFFSPITPPVL